MKSNTKKQRMIDTEHCGEEQSEGDEKRKERVGKIKFA